MIKLSRLKIPLRAGFFTLPLRPYFEEFHGDSSFSATRGHDRGLDLDHALPDGDGVASQKEPSPDVNLVDGGGDEGVLVEENHRSSNRRSLLRRSTAAPAAEGPRFPVKAFAQMCLGQPSSTLRLESHVVETLVLGSGLDVGVGLGNADDGVTSGAGGRSSFGGDDLAALNSARRDALEAICDFHGTQGWSSVDRSGLAGSEKAGNLAPWHEVVWDWYDARF